MLTFTWTYSGTSAGPVVFTTTVTGTDTAFGAIVSSGPVTSIAVLVTTPGSLAASASAPEQVSVGQWITVKLTVTSTGGAEVSGTGVALAVEEGMGMVMSGPVPAEAVTIAAGSAQTFSWTYSVSGIGTHKFRVTAIGVECGVSIARTASTAMQAQPPSTAEVVLKLPVLTTPTVYPNPFNPAKAVGGVMKFGGLPLGATVRIYSVAGLLMWEGRASSLVNLEWSGRSRSGQLLEPGVYHWVAEAPRFRQRGRLVIER